MSSSAMLFSLISTLFYIISCDDVYHSATILESHTLRINTKSASLLGRIISNQIYENGFLFIDNSSFKSLSSLSQVVMNVSKYYTHFNTNSSIYEIGLFDYDKYGDIANRTELSPSLYSVSSVTKEVFIYSHTEGGYLLNTPLYIILSCINPASCGGGQTLLYDNNELVKRLNATEIGKALLNDLDEFGWIQIRNEPDQYNTKYAKIWDGAAKRVWQKRFPVFDDMDKVNMSSLAVRYDIGERIKDSFKQNMNMKLSVHWKRSLNDTYTLQLQWKLSAFRFHPIHGYKMWLNSLYVGHGSYFDQFDILGMHDIPYMDRPHHVLIGNGRELTDSEYNLLEYIYQQIQISLSWGNVGDIVAVDNFAYQHARLPYNSQRQCVIAYGPGVIYKNDQKNTDECDDLDV